MKTNVKMRGRRWVPFGAQWHLACGLGNSFYRDENWNARDGILFVTVDTLCGISVQAHVPSGSSLADALQCSPRNRLVRCTLCLAGAREAIATTPTAA